MLLSETVLNVEVEGKKDDGSSYVGSASFFQNWHTPSSSRLHGPRPYVNEAEKGCLHWGRGDGCFKTIMQSTTTGFFHLTVSSSPVKLPSLFMEDPSLLIYFLMFGSRDCTRNLEGGNAYGPTGDCTCDVLLHHLRATPYRICVLWIHRGQGKRGSLCVS